MGRVFAPVPAAHSKIPPSVSEHINIWGNVQRQTRAVSLSKLVVSPKGSSSVPLHPPPSCAFPTAHVLPPQEKTTLFSARQGASWLHGPCREPGEGSEGGRAGDGERRPTLPKGSADLGSYLALFPLSPVFMAAWLR